MIELKRGPWGRAPTQRGWRPPPRSEALRRSPPRSPDEGAQAAMVMVEITRPRLRPWMLRDSARPQQSAAAHAPGLAPGTAPRAANHRAEHMRLGNRTVAGSFYPNWIFCMFPLRTPHACLLREPQQYFLSCVSPHTAAVF